MSNGFEEADLDGGPASSDIKVHIVLKDDNWILTKIADRLHDELGASGVSVSVSAEPQPDAHVNHFVIYTAHVERGPTLETVMATHIDDERELGRVKRQLLEQGVDMAICMSFDTVNRLAHFGLPHDRLCCILPAHDGAIKPRRLLVGLTTRLYDDGRKREELISEVSETISPDDIAFAIMGSGWELIVQQLRSRGFEVEYYDRFERRAYESLIPRLDYYLYLGRDEGSMGTLDALAAGVPTIVVPQGFHLELPSGITYAFENARDLQNVFAEIAASRRRRIDGVSQLTWAAYARKHLLVWRYLLRRDNLPVAHATLSALGRLGVAAVQPAGGQRERTDGISVAFAGCPHPSWLESEPFYHLRSTFPIAAAEAPDVVYASDDEPPDDWKVLFWRVRSNGTALVWNQGGRTTELDGDHARMRRYFVRFGIEFADHVFYRSHFAKSHADGIAAPRSDAWEVLHDAVDTAYFSPRPPRQRAGSADVLLLGARQRLDVMEAALRTLRRFRESHGEARLLVPSTVASAMSPADRRALTTLLAETGTVPFVRWIGPYSFDTAPDILAGCDVALYLGLDDPSPRELIEALACAVPVAFADSGAAAEIVGEGAGVGVSVVSRAEELPLPEPEALAAALRDVLMTSGARREIARRRAVEQFDILPWLRRHETICRRLTAEPRRWRSAAVTSAIRLIRMHPSRITLGDGFNLQPDGRSALSVEVDAASPATAIVFNHQPLPTSYGGPRLLTAVVPASLIVAGTLPVWLIEGAAESNRLDFQVDTPAARETR